MPNYRESAVSGTNWTRAVSVKVANPFNETPHIEFHEEHVLQIGEELIKRPANNIALPVLIERFTDPAVSFNLLNPETDEIIGTANYGELHVMLYSLYRHLADKRDNPAPVI